MCVLVSSVTRLPIFTELTANLGFGSGGSPHCSGTVKPLSIAKKLLRHIKFISPVSCM